MFTHITKAKYIKDFTIWASFNNGEKGNIDLQEKILSKKGIFEPLKDKSYFKNFKIINDTISWENGADLAPESLYELLKK